MGGLDAHKRSVVKHRTRTSPNKKHQSGFHTGATNVPNGAYIGRAKKLKADLIHKAKVKKAYSKLQHSKQAEQNAADLYKNEEDQVESLEQPTQDLGRFAPENPEDDLLERISKKDERPRAAPKDKTRKKLPYFVAPDKVKESKDEKPRRTREEALLQREKRHAMWNKKSPSERGRARGQPDLGARMQVMLEKIQHNK
ncbi:hypothetical protein MYAM1_000705 [Malassezia yamatoensis]|uniref:rRNA-processing protein FYV7 n=1 Tax=Malassezia yamatoensis TaxID=253288 RepID=A0AAJ5YP99_9BASI|nr:hypothetical protein MYAM1_000705 [Malassezia yamatoensis]